ncbi:MAG: c-type cytochrome [Armatimonadetes bacterium]|nr:c-type cytochrome [Armatimonadota bacterium]
MRFKLIAVSACLLAIGGLVWQTTAQSQAQKQKIARGKYLVDIGGCVDCHTPFKMGKNGPEPDMTKYMSGHPQEMKLPPPPKMEMPWIWAGAASNTAFAGPWGVTFAPNITPHKISGLGAPQWSEANFVKAIKTGKHLGMTRPIMPPMPWTAYKHMTDADLKAVYAYLMSIKPIHNVAPDYQPAESGE